MIKSFKYKGLKAFFTTWSSSGIQTNHVKRLRLQLAALHAAAEIDDMDIPGYGLHKLKGSRSSSWSIKINKNWRLTFEFKNGDVCILNYEDYH